MSTFPERESWLLVRELGPRRSWLLVLVTNMSIFPVENRRAVESGVETVMQNPERDSLQDSRKEISSVPDSWMVSCRMLVRRSLCGMDSPMLMNNWTRSFNSCEGGEEINLDDLPT